MIDYGKTLGTTKPEKIEVDDEHVWESSNIEEVHQEGTEEEPWFDGWSYDLKCYNKNEYILMVAQKNEMLEAKTAEVESGLMDAMEYMSTLGGEA